MGNSKLSEKTEELALLTMMLHEKDEQGLTFVVEILEELGKEIESEPELKRVAQAVAYVIAQKTGAPDKLISLIKAFVEANQNFLKGSSSAAFPGEDNTPKDAADSPWGKDISEHFDAELVVDFIETHNLKLDEFESALMGAAYEHPEEGSKDLDRFAKAYLHNVKGDAGTVGLDGIARATHHVEDILTTRGASDLIEPLLAYREWVISCMKAVARKETPAELSDSFISRFTAMVGAPTAKPPTVERPEPESETPAAAPVAPVSDHAAFTAQGYDISGEQDLLTDFVMEAEDHLQTVEEVLLARDSGFDEDSINKIFRAIHSVKGGSAYFNLQEMTGTSHILENLLDKVRKGQLELGKELKNLVLGYIDLMKVQFTAAGNAMKGDRKMSTTPEGAVFLRKLEQFAGGGARHDERPAPAAEKVSQPEAQKAAPLQESPAPQNTAPSPAAPSVPAREQRDSGRKEEKMDLKTFVKVDTTRLDRLIEYIGEMVISSSMLIRSCRDLLSENEGVISNSHQLEQISREIQSIGMSMRLIPIKGLLQKMSRLVWDTSKKIGKEIQFETVGEDTELDRTVIDRLADPLMHMIRNSLDHGIEMPEDRVKAGKPRCGTIRVSAFHFGGSIHIEIKDDGKGLDPDKLLKKALEKRLIADNHKLNTQEIFQLIFAPGFSTAEKVTDISGRGVGMDVVRRNIEGMRGRVHIESEVGKGAVFTIELPLTLAIIDGIETNVGEERFIIPTHSVIEFVKPTQEMISTALETGETMHFRGRFLPIFRLSSLYDVVPRFDKPTDAIVAVVECNRQHIAIMLDHVVGSCSTVIKPLGPSFQHVKGLAGCAVMPDGNIGLILDIGTLVQLARTSYSPPRRAALPTAGEGTGAYVH